MMEEQYYLDCLDRGTKLYWHTLAKARGMKLQQGDIEWVMSVPRGGIERIFNISLSQSNADQRLDELIAMIGKNEVPSGILITPSTKPDNIVGLLLEKGFQVDFDSGSGMAMNIDPSINYEKFAEDISIEPVKDEDMLRTWVNIVNTALFGEELFSFEQFHDLFKLNNTYFFLGLLDGNPASTCLTIKDKEIATIEMVSTMPEYRKNGLATAAVTAALKALYSSGVKTAILRSEKEAVKVYERIGFVEYYKRIVASYEE